MKTEEQIKKEIRNRKDGLQNLDDRFDCTPLDVEMAVIKALEWVLGGKENAR